MSAAPHKTAKARQQARERRHVRAGLIAGAVLVLITAVIFGRLNLSGATYTIRAQFASSTNLVPGSAVRIAGVDVGTVDSIAPGPNNTSIISMDLEHSARPIHADATLAIVPRLLLEGNFYVRIKPGSPGAPTLRSGALIPRAQTFVPMQLDQVLGVFDAATRSSLTSSIAELSRGLASGSSTRSATGSVPGYRGLRAAARELDGALGAVRGAAREVRGTQPGDLGRLIRHSRDVAADLAQNPAALSALVTDYSTVMAALADEARPLQASVAKLDDTLRVAPAALVAVNRALPTLTRFGKALVPALRAAPVPLGRATALLKQIDGIASDRELGGLLADLRPVTAKLPDYEAQLTRLLPFITTASRCLSARVIPVLKATVDDGNLSTGDPVWLDLLHAATGITSSTGGFDGNGSAVRAGVVAGPTNVSGLFPGAGNLMGLAPRITGVRPKWLGFNRITPFRPEASCLTQPLPTLDASSGPAPRWMRSGETAKGKRGR